MRKPRWEQIGTHKSKSRPSKTTKLNKKIIEYGQIPSMSQNRPFGCSQERWWWWWWWWIWWLSSARGIVIIFLEIIIASICGNLSCWIFWKSYLTDFRKIRLAIIGEITINRMLEDYSRRISENIIVSVAGVLIYGFWDNF